MMTATDCYILQFTCNTHNDDCNRQLYFMTYGTQLTQWWLLQCVRVDADIGHILAKFAHHLGWSLPVCGVHLYEGRVLGTVTVRLDSATHVLDQVLGVLVQDLHRCKYSNRQLWLMEGNVLFNVNVKCMRPENTWLLLCICLYTSCISRKKEGRTCFI